MSIPLDNGYRLHFEGQQTARNLTLQEHPVLMQVAACLSRFNPRRSPLTCGMRSCSTKGPNIPCIELLNSFTGPPKPFTFFCNSSQRGNSAYFNVRVVVCVAPLKVSRYGISSSNAWLGSRAVLGKLTYLATCDASDAFNAPLACAKNGFVRLRR